MVKSYEELQDELKEVLAAIKKEKVNTVPYIRLKRKANELHKELYKLEKSIGFIRQNYKVA